MDMNLIDRGHSKSPRWVEHKKNCQKARAVVVTKHESVRHSVVRLSCPCGYQFDRVSSKHLTPQALEMIKATDQAKARVERALGISRAQDRAVTPLGGIPIERETKDNE